MTHPDDPTSKPPAWWPEGAKASMNPPERSEVTDPNTPTQYFEITATPEQLEQLRQQHAWKINYQYIDATPFIQTAAHNKEHTMTNPDTTHLTPFIDGLRDDITAAQHRAHMDKGKNDNDHHYYRGLAEGIERALTMLGHDSPPADE